MKNSRLKIARKKNNFTQKQAAEIVGITPQAWSSAETGKSKLHRRNLEIVAKEFGVSLSWLVTGEGSDTISMPEDIGPGKFVRILSTQELLSGNREGEESRHIFVPGLKEEALGYSTRSELPVAVKESTFVMTKSDFDKQFENGKLYLMAIDGMLIVRKIDKVFFGTNKGTYKLTDLNGGTDFVKPKGIVLYKVVYRLDRLV